MLKRLHDILHKAGVSQSEIKNGVSLSARGYEKVSKALGVGTEEVRQLLNQLRNEHERLDGFTMATESSNRYGFEVDVLGNVQINDQESGRTKMITGSDGQSLISRMEHVPKGSEQEQSILASYFGMLTEREVNEVGEASSNGFASEINNESGTFNFPWKVGSRHGTATANYEGGEKFRLSVVSIRNADGEEIDMKPYYDKVRIQAIEFIGRE